MIFDRLTLKNFGVYLGEQTFDLTPKSDQQPIVLIGAFNGSGKTTFLDALQLIFYGKIANCSGRKGLSYDKYLASSINRAADPAEGASIKIEFRQSMSGELRSYVVTRSWKVENGSAKEQFSVSCDGVRDPVLSDGWSEHLEEILPSRIAPLFFFDGEKIEQFADPVNAKEVMRSAVSALLGLDIVDRLDSDLDVLRNRNKEAGFNAGQREAISELATKLQGQEHERKSLEDQKSLLDAELVTARQQLLTVHEEFDAQGGSAAKQRDELNRKESDLKHEIARVEKDLRKTASEILPLILAKDLLHSIGIQASKEDHAAKAVAVLEEIAGRDEDILKLLDVPSVPNDVRKNLLAFIEKSQVDLEKRTMVDAYLHFSNEAQNQIQSLNAGAIDDARKAVIDLLKRLNSLQEALVVVERKISSIPADEIFYALLAKVKEAESVVLDLENKVTAAEHKIAEQQRAIDLTRREIAGQLDRFAEGTMVEDDKRRINEHAGRVKSYLREFRDRMLKHRITAIESEVLDCLRRLYQKEELISNVRIDPQDLSMHLLGKGDQEVPLFDDGRTISADRLSAGERQLLALGILWALANLSNKPAPVVIDTPLGRLDSRHRSNLLRFYFPHASHQVIILSTDEEIDQAFYDEIRPSMSHCYRIDYDPSKNGSVVRAGYFFEEAAA